MFDCTLVPASGRVLAYAPDSLIYDAYMVVDGHITLRDGSVLDLSDVYEIHCFDVDTELRGIRKGGEWRHYVMMSSDEDLDEDEGFVFSEVQCVQAQYCVEGSDEKIVVVNRFAYDQNDCVYLKSYRLSMPRP